MDKVAFILGLEPSCQKLERTFWAKVGEIYDLCLDVFQSLWSSLASDTILEINTRSLVKLMRSI